jgi:YVTN family beta-propeller protein
MIGILVLALAAILSNNTFAQSLHDKTLDEVVNQTSGLDESAQIEVGDNPRSIHINEKTNTIYIVNFLSDSVSVISGENNTRIKDIPVGNGPVDIAINEFTDKVYVANAFSNSISVIDGRTNTKIEDDIPMENGAGNMDILGDDPGTYEPGSNGTLYVLNGNDSVSVINATTDEKIGEDIPVGNGPREIVVDDFADKVYVANYDNASISVINGWSNRKIEDIPVGVRPTAIDLYQDPSSISSNGRIYVANDGNDTVSVIDGSDNTKIGEDIPLPGASGPSDIDALQDSIVGVSHNKVYVANRYNNSVSVIDVNNNTRIKDIPVGDGPEAIASYPDDLDADAIYQFVNPTVYVANYGIDSIFDSVSVINATTDEKIGEDIPVGNGPSDIGVNKLTNTVYVVNSISDSISVIDSIANEVVAGTVFKVNPFNSGYILCDNLTTPSPLGQYIYVHSGAECTAKPNEGFGFSSWEENLEGNATQLINFSRPVSQVDSVLEFLHLKSSDKPEATMNITKFGTFTANFREVPPAIPSEYWIPLYGIIASTIVGWSIPSIIGWTKSKRDVGQLNYYHKEIASLYGDGKLDENDTKELDKLRNNIVDAYSRGKINEKHYESLKNEISILYDKIFRKRINDLLHNASKETTEEQLNKIKTDLEYAYSEGKINEKHYDLLSKAISNLETKERDKLHTD